MIISKIKNTLDSNVDSHNNTANDNLLLENILIKLAKYIKIAHAQ